MMLDKIFCKFPDDGFGRSIADRKAKLLARKIIKKYLLQCTVVPFTVEVPLPCVVDNCVLVTLYMPWQRG